MYPSLECFRAALVRLRDQYNRQGISTVDINYGYCADFATIIWEQFRSSGKVKVLDNTDLDKDSAAEYIHSFIKFEGKYYDAECIDGVENWEDLPIFSRV